MHSSVTPCASAKPMASSVSVESLPSGWRSTGMPWASAHDRPLSLTESRSPTTRSGRRPAPRAWSSPESAAMMNASLGSDCTTAASNGAPPVTMTTPRCSVECGDTMHGSLRWHYPDQVEGSAPAGTLSARRSCELPELWLHRSARALGGNRRFRETGMRSIRTAARAALVEDDEGHQPREDERHAGQLPTVERLAEQEVRPDRGERRLTDLGDTDRADRNRLLRVDHQTVRADAGDEGQQQDVLPTLRADVEQTAVDQREGKRGDRGYR